MMHFRAPSRSFAVLRNLLIFPIFSVKASQFFVVCNPLKPLTSWSCSLPPIPPIGRVPSTKRDTALWEKASA